VVDRSTGYRAIRNDTFPVMVIRVGRLIRIPTAALERFLGGEPEAARPAPGTIDPPSQQLTPA
jgi:hypothetical protein